jgi:ribosomal protein L11 methyltransferase
MKPAKQLWRVSITTSPEAEDAVAELLGTIFNCNASSYFDVEPQTSVVSIYFSEKRFLSREVSEEIFAGLNRIKNCGLKIGSGKIKIAKVRREDWAESWKRHFKPIEIGNSLLVKPSWIKKRPRKNQAIVVLDPGLSFGTGQHPTTEFCLREMVRFGERARPGRGSMRLASNFLTGRRGVRQNARGRACSQSFLDIGTGSGILAIAAAKLGYKPVRAMDFDPEAVRVAQANSKANGVLRNIKILRGDVTGFLTKPKEQFDLVCANLISNLLIAERKKIVAQLEPSGILVLAGILKSEFWEVQKEFESLGLKLISSRSKKEWRSGSFCFA